MNHFNELINAFINDPMQSIFLLCSIIVIEIVLSVDNAALLATMIKNLSEKEQKQALTYGIIGAYVFRGLSLCFIGLLIQLWWLKVVGGIYLIWMCINYFKTKSTETTDDDIDKPADKSTFYKWTVGLIGSFWATVVAVEFMDLTLSVDNVFAVVAMSDNMVMIVLGVFVGILAMRFVAQKFVKLMHKYPIMEKSAFLVIGLLGLKLTLSMLVHFVPSYKWIEGEDVDMCVSALTLLVFIVPILYLRFIKKIK